MAWPQPKDTNYYTRLNLISKIKKYVETHLEYDVPYVFEKPIVYEYHGGCRKMINIAKYKYMSFYKTEFTTITCLLDDQTFVRLIHLKNRHLLKIYQALPK